MRLIALSEQRFHFSITALTWKWTFLKSPVSAICTFLSMKSKRQTNMSAFVHWRISRTECICSSGVGYHMRLWDTPLNVISTHKAFHFILLLQNDNKTEKNMKLCCIQSPSWEVNSGKVFASYRSDHLNNTLTAVSRKSKGNNTISDVNVSGQSFCTVRHRPVVKLSSFQLDTFRQTSNTNCCWEHLFMFAVQMFYIRTIKDAFQFLHYVPGL